MHDAGGVALALDRRWRGQSGRLEAWYATFTDPDSGMGCWVHHEIVAPTRSPAHHHGWTAVFLPDAAPVLERFGPFPCTAAHTSQPSVPPAGAPPVEPADGVVFHPPALRGERGQLAWDLHWDASAAPDALFTFPRWAWRRGVLPAAHVVPVPERALHRMASGGHAAACARSRHAGTVGHIYGHGNAERWGWAHAELGGGDVLEIVSATSRRPGMRHLPPLAFVQLRTGGRDWPRHPLATAPLFRTNLDLPTWTVRGTVGPWRLRATITIPPERAVRVAYRDPDDAGATCTNSEAADAEIVLEHKRWRWEVAAHWSINGAAHAEVGTRP